MRLHLTNIYQLQFAFSSIVLAVSLFLQYGIGLTPCPLCLIARFVVAFIVLITGLQLLQKPSKRGKVVYALILLVLTLFGILVSARHIWLLNLPPALVPACTPGLDYLLETLPILEVVIVILNGSGECAQSDGALLGLPLPAWTLIAFAIMLTLSILPLFKYFGSKKG